MDLAFCPHGGWLVSTEPVPADPADHWTSALRDPLGCNRLACSACGAPVRSAPDLEPARKLARHLDALADTADWTTSPLLKRTHLSRLYACRCRFVVEAMTRDLLRDPDPNPQTDLGLPWACAGHPPPTLPLVVDGVAVGEGTDLRGLVAAALRGEVPPGAGGHARAVPAFWLSRLHHRLRGLPASVAVSRAVADAFAGDEASAIGSALWFFRDWPHAAGAERIERLVARVGVDAEFPVPFLGRTHPTCPALALAARLLASETVEPEVLALMRAAALSRAPVLFAPDAGVELVSALALHDAEWLARNAAAVAEPDAARAQRIPGALAGHGREALALVARAALGESVLDALGGGREPWGSIKGPTGAR